MEFSDDNLVREDGDVRVGTMIGEGKITKRDVVAELKKQLWLAGPLIATSVLQNMLQLISIIFVGHLGELQLSGASMATSVAAVTGFSVMTGMTSALETLCGQAHGAKRYNMLGIHMQGAMIVVLGISIPIGFIWAFAGQILMAIGQDEEISRAAGHYCRILIPGLFAYGFLHCLIRFLMSQGIVFPLMMCSSFTTALHILMSWALVFRSDLGSSGAAIALDISYWVNFLLLVFFVKLSPTCRASWTGFSREAFHHILKFVKLALPSALMICVEFWAFEALVLMAGRLPNPKMQTSVLAIILNTSSLSFMISFGFGFAISTRVSNELGAGHPRAACLAVWVVVSLTTIEGLALGLTLFLIRRGWGRMFSNVTEVSSTVAAVLPFLALSSFLDGIQCVLSGAARGCGRQKIIAFANIGAYYLVGIPASAILAFVLHLKAKGLWMGILCGIALQLLLLIIITLRTDWEKEANNAFKRAYDSNIPVETATTERMEMEIEMENII